MRGIRRRLLSVVALGAVVLSGLVACAAPSASPAPAPAAKSAAPPAGGAAAAPPAAGAPTSVPAAAAPPPREPWTYGQVSVFAIYWPHYVGMHQGFFDQEGLEFERIVGQSAAQLISGVASASVNSASTLPDGTVRAVEQGAPLAVVAVEQDTAIYSLMTTQNIGSFADLRGKPIGAAEPRGSATLILRKMLSANGLGEDAYDLVIVGGTRERYTGLKVGTINAGLLSQPQDFQLRDEGFPRLALSTDYLKPYTFGGITMNRDWARQNEARTVRYLRGLIRSTRWLNDPANKDAAVRILMEETKTEERYARLTYELYIEELKVMPREAEIDPRGIETVLDLMIEGGDLAAPRPPVSRYVDTSFWEKARQAPGQAR